MNGQSMRKIPGLYLALVLTSLLSACAGQGRPGLEKTAVEDDVGGKAEEVYVFRTTRMRHERGQTPACAPAPFTSAKRTPTNCGRSRSEHRTVGPSKTSPGYRTAMSVGPWSPARSRRSSAPTNLRTLTCLVIYPRPLSACDCGGNLTPARPDERRREAAYTHTRKLPRTKQHGDLCRGAFGYELDYRAVRAWSA